MTKESKLEVRLVRSSGQFHFGIRLESSVRITEDHLGLKNGIRSEYSLAQSPEKWLCPLMKVTNNVAELEPSFC